MKSLRSFFLFAGIVLLSAVASFSQSPRNPSPTRSNAVVSVQELAMSRKATHAFEKGTTLLLKGDVQGSVPYFRTVIEEAPSSYRAYHNLGLALYRLGQLDDAVQYFQQSIDLTNGNFAPSMFALSMILYQHHEFPQAESLIRRGLYLEPASSVGKYCLGLIQYSLGRFDDAQRSASEALALNSRETDAYVLLARTHERQHNPSAVVADVQNYLRLDPHGALQPQALDLLHRAQQDLSPQPASLN